METGNYYLLEVYSSWEMASKFIILDYLTRSTSNWEFTLPKLVLPAMYPAEDLPPIYDLVEEYSNQGDRFKFMQFLPLISITSLADDYPELFI